jgi:hypothetical protein
MNNKAILLKSSGSIVCVTFLMAMIFMIIGLPAKDISKNIYPIIKGPRPYKTDIAGLNYFNDDSISQVSKKESSFYPIIIEAADKHDVDPDLIKAIIMAESRYNPMATSEKGAIGLMQIMPRTASASNTEDMYDPVHNINVGAEYLKKLLSQFNGNQELALAAYNAGPSKVMEYEGVPPYEATICYIKKVLEYYRYYLDT